MATSYLHAIQFKTAVELRLAAYLYLTQCESGGHRAQVADIQNSHSDRAILHCCHVRDVGKGGGEYGHIGARECTGNGCRVDHIGQGPGSW